MYYLQVHYLDGSTGIAGRGWHAHGTPIFTAKLSVAKNHAARISGSTGRDRKKIASVEIREVDLEATTMKMVYRQGQQWPTSGIL